MADSPVDQTPGSTAAPSRHRLDGPAVAAGLTRLGGWTGDEAAITLELDAADFRSAIRLVNVIAELAEAMDHHPDIDIRWRHLRLVLHTHSSGGVTETDLVLAEAIDRAIATGD